MLTSYFSLFLFGLASATHCIGMCGSIQQLFLNMSHSPRESLFIYNAGRISSYLMIALIVAFLATNVTYRTAEFIPWAMVLRIFAGMLLIYLGLQKLIKFKTPHTMQKMGSRIWQTIRGWAKPIMPPKYRWQVFLIGCIWGWLPCGMVYAALTLALTTNSITGSVIGMACFAIGTLPAMIGIGLVGQSLQQQLKLQKILAVFLIVMGVYTVLSSFIS